MSMMNSNTIEYELLDPGIQRGSLKEGIITCWFPHPFNFNTKSHHENRPSQEYHKKTQIRTFV
jgi:hypothetical protein